MTQQTEWEVVDAPRPYERITPQKALEKLFGRWWRWKVGGLALVAGTALLLTALLAGVFVLIAAAVVLVFVGTAKLAYWLRKPQAGDRAADKGIVRRERP